MSQHSEEPLQGDVDVSIGLRQNIQDGLLVGEAHLLDLRELFSVFFPVGPRVGLLGRSTESLSAHQLLQQCGVDASHSAHTSHAAHAGERVRLLLLLGLSSSAA